MATMTKKRRAAGVTKPAIKLSQRQAQFYQGLYDKAPRNKIAAQIGVSNLTANCVVKRLRALGVVGHGKMGVAGSIPVLKRPHEVLFPGETALPDQLLDKSSWRKNIKINAKAILVNQDWAGAWVLADMIEENIGNQGLVAPLLAFLRQRPPASVTVDQALPKIAASSSGPRPPDYPVMPDDIKEPPAPGGYPAYPNDGDDRAAVIAWMAAKAEAQERRNVWHQTSPEIIAYWAAQAAWMDSPEHQTYLRNLNEQSRREWERLAYANPYDTWLNSLRRLLQRLVSAGS